MVLCDVLAGLRRPGSRAGLVGGIRNDIGKGCIAPKARIARALRRAGRLRGIDQKPLECTTCFACPVSSMTRWSRKRWASTRGARKPRLDVECARVEQLGRAAAEAFRRHHERLGDHEVPRSG